MLAWGGDPRTLDWFDPPGAAALDAAFDLLESLGAVAGGKLTPLGTRMEAMPLHPRLARILVEAGGARAIAVACALLTERRTDAIAPDQRGATTTSDLLTLAGAVDPPPHVQRVARELEKLAGGTGSRIDERAFRRALLAGYPDRVGKRRASGSARVLLASGHGAVIGPESGVRDAEYLVALDVTAGQRGENAEARIRIASQVDREWLQPTDVRVEHVLDAASGSVRASERDYYGSLVLTERPIQPDPAQAAALLATEYLRRGLTAEDEQVMRRLRFAGIQLSADALVTAAAHGARTLKDIDLSGALDWTVRQTLDRDAPDRLSLPGQRSVALDYRDDGVVVAEVKLQWLFGVRETPRIGARREPVLLALLAPNGRPVQLTHDLESFWSRTYHDVRKELRGRYPKHAWPENPLDEPPRR